MIVIRHVLTKTNHPLTGMANEFLMSAAAVDHPHRGRKIKHPGRLRSGNFSDAMAKRDYRTEAPRA